MERDVPSPHSRIGRALEALHVGLFPFVSEKLSAFHGEHWVDVARASFRQDRAGAILSQLPPEEWDSQALLAIMWDQWNVVFRPYLGLFERSLVSELREFRNRWAHQSDLSDDDSFRVIDSVERLLAAIAAPEQLLIDLERMKLDLMRERLNREISQDVQRARSNRARLLEIGVYAFCGFAIVFAAIFFLGPRNLVAAIMISGFALVTFVFLVVRRLQISEVVHGVHECTKCRKIIYSEVCPYCEAPPPSSSIIARSSSRRFPPFADVPPGSARPA